MCMWLSGISHEMVWLMWSFCMSLGWTGTAVTLSTLAGSIHEVEGHLVRCIYNYYTSCNIMVAGSL